MIDETETKESLRSRLQKGIIAAIMFAGICGFVFYKNLQASAVTHAGTTAVTTEPTVLEYKNVIQYSIIENNVSGPDIKPAGPCKIVNSRIVYDQDSSKVTLEIGPTYFEFQTMGVVNGNKLIAMKADSSLMALTLQQFIVSGDTVSALVVVDEENFLIFSNKEKGCLTLEDITN